MGRFRDLLNANNHLPPGEQQRLASELFPSAVSNTQMSMWAPGDPFPATGTRMLIGVAVYSLYDLDLLDTLESNSLGQDTVHLFNVNSCTTMSDFENCIPGIGNVFQTPVVGYWQDSQLLHREQGAAARDWIRDRYALPQIQSVQ